VGGDRIEYYLDTTAPAASLIEAKMLFNSTISQTNKNARFFTLDIKDFFLQTNMENCEYMKIHSKYFCKELREKYNIDSLIANDGYVYCKIKKGMYGLKQATRLAYDDLVTHFSKYGYSPDPITKNMWSHNERKTKFCLYVDDFSVQCFSEEDKQLLINVLKEKCDITIDHEGKNFCGLQLDWNYSAQYVDISMPKFALNTLTKLKYKRDRKHQYAPHEWTVPIYEKNDNLPNLKIHQSYYKNVILYMYNKVAVYFYIMPER